MCKQQYLLCWKHQALSAYGRVRLLCWGAVVCGGCFHCVSNVCCWIVFIGRSKDCVHDLPREQRVERRELPVQLQRAGLLPQHRPQHVRRVPRGDVRQSNWPDAVSDVRLWDVLCRRLHVSGCMHCGLLLQHACISGNMLPRRVLPCWVHRCCCVLGRVRVRDDVLAGAVHAWLLLRCGHHRCEPVRCRKRVRHAVVASALHAVELLSSGHNRADALRRWFFLQLPDNAGRVCGGLHLPRGHDRADRVQPWGIL